MAMASAPLPSGSDVTHIEVCRKFLKGECPFRDCKFAHPERHVELTGDWVRVCLDHLQGKCNRDGMKYPCKYYHVPEHLKPYGSVQPPTTPKPPKVDRTIQLCKRFSHMACTFNDCKFAHVNDEMGLDVQDNRVTICLEWLRSGGSTCPAEKCKDYHLPSHLLGTYAPLVGTEAAVAGALAKPPTDAQPACAAHAAGQACAAGQTAAADAPSKGPPDYLDACRKYLQGQCTFSDCRFAHPEQHHLTHLKDGKLRICRTYLGQSCTSDQCPDYHLPDHLLHHDWSDPGTKKKALGAPTELDVCRRFQNGECSFSDCKFAHPEVHVSVASNGKVSVCRQFLTGQCAEAACSQYHLPDHLRHRDWNEEKHAKRPRLAGASMSPASSMAYFCPPAVDCSVPGKSNIDFQTMELDVCRKFLKGECTFRDCRFAHPYAPNLIGVSMQRLKVCRNYIQGMCKEQGCLYYHLPVHLLMEAHAFGGGGVVAGYGGNDPAAMAVAAAAQWNAKEAANVEGDKIAVCRAFRVGDCSGTSCPDGWAHPPPQVQITEDGYVKVCTDAMRGMCNRNGWRVPCRYYHLDGCAPKRKRD
uniref:C3H1-type domain-containing protein n=1 Tax=Eutreptiella gymnastica TaxID=73025 RepID=A0A7S4FXZ4_9EUGL